MNMVTKFLGAGIALAGSAFASHVNAAPYLSGFVFVDSGNPTGASYTPSGNGLGNATSVKFGSNNTTTGFGQVYQTNVAFTIATPNVFLGVGTSGPVANNTFSWLANGITFTMISTSANYNSTTSTVGTVTTDFVNLSYFGSLTNDSTSSSAASGSFLGGLLPTQSGTVTATFSSIGPNGSVSQNGTFATPAPVPEPVSMVLLGTGLVGLLAARRRV